MNGISNKYEVHQNIEKKNKKKVCNFVFTTIFGIFFYKTTKLNNYDFIKDKTSHLFNVDFSYCLTRIITIYVRLCKILLISIIQYTYTGSQKSIFYGLL